MLCEFANLLYQHGLTLKASKSHWLANDAAWQLLPTSSFDMRIRIMSQWCGASGVDFDQDLAPVPLH
eukprot:7686427-Karenia_brevis.AAC.1